MYSICPSEGQKVKEHIMFFYVILFIHYAYDPSLNILLDILLEKTLDLQHILAVLHRH